MKNLRRLFDLKTLLAAIWLIFTLSLVVWWWIFVLRKAPSITSPEYRMILLEGSVLITSILAGGVYLMLYTYRDMRRHQRLKLFFANFSHDIKTSIARLRLQAEVLAEDSSVNNPILSRLVNDIQRLDLQLENSLLFSSLSDTELLDEKIKLSHILNQLRLEYVDLRFELEKDVCITGDRRALLSIFRNLVNNAHLHGEADEIKFSTQATENKVNIVMYDNGKPFEGDVNRLGVDLLKTSDSRSNGLGLLLSRRLCTKMKGSLEFSIDKNKRFARQMTFRGSAL